MYGNYLGQVPPINQIDRQIEDLQRIKDQYRQPMQPINNIINTNTNGIELKVLKDENVEDIYVQTKTIFKNDKQMIIKDVDGNIEKYEIKKTYPLDKKDLRISELEAKLKELEGGEDNEPKSTSTTKTSKK